MQNRIFPLLVIVMSLAACGGRTGLLELSTDAGPVSDIQWLNDLIPVYDTVPQCNHPAVKKKCQGGWCEVPAGCFTMGSPVGEACRFPNETAHRTTLKYGFIMAATEVTQGEFSKLMGYAPSYFKGCSTCPVEQVTWHEAVAYCNALTERAKISKGCYRCTGTGSKVSCRMEAEWSITNMKSIYMCPGYRLPTEAEWEYAYRAGTTTHYYSGDLKACTGKNPTLDKIAWYDQNSGKRTQPTARKQPNGWGLYDLGGNVWEWSHDRWRQDLGAAWKFNPVGPSGGDNLSVRGGSWDTIAGDMRAAFRDKYTIDKRYTTVGFRCVRSGAL